MSEFTIRELPPPTDHPQNAVLSWSNPRESLQILPIVGDLFMLGRGSLWFCFGPGMAGQGVGSRETTLRGGEACLHCDRALIPHLKDLRPGPRKACAPDGVFFLLVKH